MKQTKTFVLSVVIGEFQRGTDRMVRSAPIIGVRHIIITGPNYYKELAHKMRIALDDIIKEARKTLTSQNHYLRVMSHDLETTATLQ